MTEELYKEIDGHFGKCALIYGQIADAVEHSPKKQMDILWYMKNNYSNTFNKFLKVIHLREKLATILDKGLAINKKIDEIIEIFEGRN